MEIIKKDEESTLSVRVTTSLKQMQQALGEIYGEIGVIFGQDGISCIGSPFVIYYNMDMENLDIEAGFPVAGAAQDYGRVKRSTLPGGKQVVAQHKGPYDRLVETYKKLSKFCEKKGITPKEFMYEEYLNSPEEVSAEELLTNIYFIL